MKSVPPFAVEPTSSGTLAALPDDRERVALDTNVTLSTTGGKLKERS